MERSDSEAYDESRLDEPASEDFAWERKTYIELPQDEELWVPQRGLPQDGFFSTARSRVHPLTRHPLEGLDPGSPAGVLVER
jgi:hypothetical protein